MNNMKYSKYFSNAEFQHCIPACSINDMDDNLLTFIDNLRESIKKPLILTSAYRSPEYDKSKGRSGKSAHTEGKAVDIQCNDSQLRWKIISNALALGCTRIGVGNTFVHLDISTKLPQNVIWHYYN